MGQFIASRRTQGYFLSGIRSHTMVALHLQLTVVLCLFLAPYLSLAYPRKSLFERTIQKRETAPEFVKYNVFKSIPWGMLGVVGGSMILHCDVFGQPPALIYWVKDGVRIHQGDTHTGNSEHHVTSDGRSRLEVSSTQSRLYLDCLSEEDAGIYVCVGHNPTVTIQQERTVVIVEESKMLVGQKDCKLSGQPRIFMWTSSRLEYETGTVQLFCRAQGSPTPTITWYNGYNVPIDLKSDTYTVTPAGDLIIRALRSVFYYGDFICEAKNSLGTDTVTTIVYPTVRIK
ncbi:zwei Ig domain protein zig-4-like [Physella acuta]|uniref:zwei Ig domain protein zig-4-like n=1 Tax=Physella acuta TaxID=109671 RepID=UPI0027DB5313|nr:zwei Ig domain protein zig-4-like [Physella acuta]